MGVAGRRASPDTPQNSSRAPLPFFAFISLLRRDLLDTCCRRNRCVTRCKKTVGVHLTRHNKKHSRTQTFTRVFALLGAPPRAAAVLALAESVWRRQFFVRARLQWCRECPKIKAASAAEGHSRQSPHRLLAALPRAAVLLALATAAAIAIPARAPDHATPGDWPSYGHDPAGTRYSALSQITRENVANLKVAWTFHVGDISDGRGGQDRSGMETTPILVDGTLYLTSGFNRVFALDPETGRQRWVYDPAIERSGPYGDRLINRGVATWLDPARTTAQPCRRRIFEATLDARLIALE